MANPLHRIHVPGSKDTWATPQELFDQLNAEWGFTLDVCAIPENAKCAKFFSPDDDALSQEWSGVCWMNPPYGRAMRAWMKKAYESSQAGATVVCLVPSSTDTAWWHDYAMKGQITFLRGRVKFGGSKDNAPFASAIVVFAPEIQNGGAREQLERELDEAQRQARQYFYDLTAPAAARLILHGKIVGLESALRALAEVEK